MKHTLLLMAVMALTTYLIRMLPFVVFRRKITSRFARSFLSYAPYAVLTAMTIPSVFTSTGSVPSAVAGFAVAGGRAFAFRTVERLRARAGGRGGHRGL